MSALTCCPSLVFQLYKQVHLDTSLTERISVVM